MITPTLNVMNKNIFYDYHDVLSRNALFNIILGERGTGKTYGCTKLFLNDFIKKGRQFVYVRRFASELEEAVPKLFADMVDNNEFPDHELKVKESKKKGSLFYCDGEICGYAVALSTSSKLKGSSFPNVKNIMFDEFTLEDDGVYHYLRNEGVKFMGLYETVARLKEDMRVFLLGNSTSITNPYFSFFNIVMPKGCKMKVFKGGDLLVQYVENKAYREAKRNSRFGRLVEGTAYADYAIENKMLNDSAGFLRKKTEAARNVAIIKLNGCSYGVWRDFEENMVFISMKYDPNCPNVFAMSVNDHNEQTVLMKAKYNTWFKMVKDAFEYGLLYFENQKIKNEVMQILMKY